MDYKDTVNGMLSPDYKERFKAEYYQTKIRYDKLKAINNKIEATRHLHCRGYRPDFIDFEPSCDPDYLEEQQHVMGRYLHILEVRAVIEGIEL